MRFRHPGLAFRESGRAGWGVPETMENSRRWGGYVCPNCRLVFRVPPEHAGLGVECPSCHHLLRIPLVGESTPPLVTVTTAGEEWVPRVEAHRTRGIRPVADQAWDHAPSVSGHLSRGERRQMFWWLMGGGALFVVILAGVLAILLGSKPPRPPTVDGQLAVLPKHPVAVDPAPVRTDAAFLAEAELLAQRFLDAQRVDDLLPLVRDPGVAEARMRQHYAGGKLEPFGMAQFNTNRLVDRYGAVSTLKVRTRNHAEQSLAFVTTAQGLKIDWESWVGWSEMPWEEFLTTKPTTPRAFRVLLSAVDYYNFAFADDLKWQAYRLTSPDESHAIYGYAPRGSKVNAALRPPPEATSVRVTLALKFPELPQSNNQVLIERLVADGWVLEPELPP